jgi:hypothetical protein
MSGLTAHMEECTMAIVTCRTGLPGITERVEHLKFEDSGPFVMTLISTLLFGQYLVCRPR